MAKRNYRPDDEHERDDSGQSDVWRERRGFNDPRYRAEREPQRGAGFSNHPEREDEQYASFYDSERRDRAGWPFDDERREARAHRRTDTPDDEYRGPASAERRYGPGGVERRKTGSGRARDESFGERPYDYERRSDEQTHDSTSGRDDDDAPYYRGYYRSSATPVYWAGGSGSLVSQSWTITGPHTGKGPKGYRRSKDQIVEEASQRLQQSGRIDASNIDVSCDNGVLTLRGTVDDRRMKRAAEDCVESIFGVEDVANELRVQRRATQEQEQEQPGDNASRRPIPKTGP